MKFVPLILIVSALGISATASAEARNAKRYQPPIVSRQSMVERYYNDPYYGYQNGQVCRRWCPEDRTPCDPVHFKAADGRCSPGNVFPVW
jgi:hypothetical protein